MNGLDAGVALLPDPKAKAGVLGLATLSVLNVFKGAEVEPPLTELAPKTNGWLPVDTFDPNAPALAGFIDALPGAPKVKAGAVTPLGPLLLSKGFLAESAFATVLGAVPKGELVPFAAMDLLAGPPSVNVELLFEVPPNGFAGASFLSSALFTAWLPNEKPPKAGVVLGAVIPPPVASLLATAVVGVVTGVVELLAPNVKAGFEAGVLLEGAGAPKLNAGFEGVWDELTESGAAELELDCPNVKAGLDGSSDLGLSEAGAPNENGDLVTVSDAAGLDTENCNTLLVRESVPMLTSLTEKEGTALDAAAGLSFDFPKLNSPPDVESFLTPKLNPPLGAAESFFATSGSFPPKENGEAAESVVFSLSPSLFPFTEAPKEKTGAGEALADAMGGGKAAGGAFSPLSFF